MGGSSLISTTSTPAQAATITSPNPQHSLTYFNKWRTIRLNKRTKFTEVLDNLAPQSMWDKYQKGKLQGRTMTLPKGSIIKVKNGRYNWQFKSASLPTSKKHYHWNTTAIFDYIKPSAPVIAPSSFNHKRKIKLTKNVEMIKQRQGTPNAFTRIIGYKTLKKGSIITAQNGINYPYRVWGKQLPVTNKNDFWIALEPGKWYKIID